VGSLAGSPEGLATDLTAFGFTCAARKGATGARSSLSLAGDVAVSGVPCDRPSLVSDQYCLTTNTVRFTVAPMEDDGHGRKFQKDLNTGLVALVLLAVLGRSPEDLYGYEIAKRLQRANEGDALFKEGTIYPVLRTLSASGLLTSRIVPSYSGPPRRYYRITDEGRAVLQQWSGIWRQTRDFVDRFIEGKAS
jgi:PadR family transcriptional regulator, regulatory protein PadR